MGNSNSVGAVCEIWEPYVFITENTTNMRHRFGTDYADAFITKIMSIKCMSTGDYLFSGYNFDVMGPYDIADVTREKLRNITYSIVYRVITSTI